MSDVPPTNIHQFLSLQNDDEIQEWINALNLIQVQRGLVAESSHHSSPMPNSASRRRRARPKGKAKRPLNSYMAFRTYYSAIFASSQQKNISGHLRDLWGSDPFKAKWTIIAKAYSIIRDTVGREFAPLDVFLAIACPNMNIISPTEYLCELGWEMSTNEDGSITMSRQLIPIPSSFDTTTNLSVDDLVDMAVQEGYVNIAFTVENATPPVVPTSTMVMAAQSLELNATNDLTSEVVHTHHTVPLENFQKSPLSTEMAKSRRLYKQWHRSNRMENMSLGNQTVEARYIQMEFDIQPNEIASNFMTSTQTVEPIGTHASEDENGILIAPYDTDNISSMTTFSNNNDTNNVPAMTAFSNDTNTVLAMAAFSNNSDISNVPTMTTVSNNSNTENVPAMVTLSNNSSTGNVPALAALSSNNNTNNVAATVTVSNNSNTENVPTMAAHSNNSNTENVPAMAAFSNNTNTVLAMAALSNNSDTENVPAMTAHSNNSHTNNVPAMSAISNSSDTETNQLPTQGIVPNANVFSYDQDRHQGQGLMDLASYHVWSSGLEWPYDELFHPALPDSPVFAFEGPMIEEGLSFDIDRADISIDVWAQETASLGLDLEGYAL